MTKKYGLAFHTTTPQLGISIDNFDGDRRSRVWDLGRDLSVYLHQSLQEIIQPQTWANLEFIAVAKGPGGFTGTRIGVVTARTLAQQLNIPLFGISSLAGIAFNYLETNNSLQLENNSLDRSLLAVQMKARREQLFVAIYQFLPQNNRLETYLPDTIMSEEDWQQTLSNLDHSYQLIEAPLKIADTATSVLTLAHQQWQSQKITSWQEVVPFYGQHPVS